MNLVAEALPHKIAKVNELYFYDCADLWLSRFKLLITMIEFEELIERTTSVLYILFRFPNENGLSANLHF